MSNQSDTSNNSSCNSSSNEDPNLDWESNCSGCSNRNCNKNNEEQTAQSEQIEQADLDSAFDQKSSDDEVKKFKFAILRRDGARDYFLAAPIKGTNTFAAIYYKENGPARILADGTEEYYTNGKKGRADDYAVISPEGYKEWWNNGRHGRLNKPATVFPDGGVEYIYNGRYHRTDGPAIIYGDGRKLYYYEGKQINASTDKEFKRKIRLTNMIF